jgi:predicted transcriptional regulator
MPMTECELRDFSEYAQRKLIEGGTVSLEDCLREWREAQVNTEDAASIRRGLAQADAGDLRKFDEVDAELRRKYGMRVGS